MSEEQKQEENMDRKSGRQSCLTAKGSAVENNGNGSNQKYIRNSRHKDVGTRAYEQAGPTRKPQPQKTRFLDKRPRSRGFYNGNSRDQMTSVEMTGPEHGSVQLWGSKKTNLSHLLNFHFEPRELYGRGRGNVPGSYRKGRGRNIQGHAARYNKEHFLQANCQFIVKESADYALHAVDPDTLVDWDLIEQVRIYNHSVPSCPICLFPPTAAKITRCGHIYCTSCILHYLSLSEKPWRRCPICYDAVQQKDLKSVLSLATHCYTAGEEITMKLMKRRRGTTLALPVDQWSDNEGHLYNIVGDVDTRYIKLLAISPSQVQEILDTEKNALLHQLQEEGQDSLEGSYIQAALDLLKAREATLIGDNTVADDDDGEISLSGLTIDGEETKPIEIPKPKLKSPDMKPVTYADAFSEEEAEDVGSLDENVSTDCPDIDDDHTNVDDSLQPDLVYVAGCGQNEDQEVLEDEESAQLSEEHINDVDDSPATAAADREMAAYYYFYQAADGQHIYPHSINARCLIKEYGSLENSPPTITARIVELEDLTMNEGLRMRLRYLSHLPVTCEFQIAELALKPPLVSVETHRLFSGEIERRKKQRQRKNRKENKLSRRIQQQENKELGFDPSALIVPSEAPSRIVPSAAVTGNRDIDSLVDETSAAGSSDVPTTSPVSAGSSDDGSHMTALSFAQMLRAGKAKPREAFPKTNSSPCLSESKSVSKDSDSETEDEDRVPAPAYQASFGDAIQQALDKYKTPGADTDVGSSAQASVGKKKKRKQKTLLFATTMNRAK